MANYGDVALGLKPDWSRSKENDQNYALQIVGHENGEADVYLKDEPDQAHQFVWVPLAYRDTVSVYSTKGYSFVKKAEGWVKRENLWEWDAEGFVLSRWGRLMARTKERFLEDMEKRRIQRERVMGSGNDDDKRAREIAERTGIQITEDDRPVRRRGLRNG